MAIEDGQITVTGVATLTADPDVYFDEVIALSATATVVANGLVTPSAPTGLPGTGFEFSLPQPGDILWSSVTSNPALGPQGVAAFRAEVTDQGSRPRCVSHATASLKGRQEFIEHRRYFELEEALFYEDCKAIDGLPGIPGTSLRAAITVLQNTGYLSLAAPYKSDDDVRFFITDAYLVQTDYEIKEAIASGFSVLLGMEIDANFYTPEDDGTLPAPTGTIVGSHAMLVVGWDDTKECPDSTGAFRLKNSWGSDYGDGGYVWVPYTYFSTYQIEAWAVLDTVDTITP